VTGGDGLLGRRAVASVLAQGADVTVGDLRPFAGDPSVRVVTGDLVEPVPAASPDGRSILRHSAAHVPPRDHTIFDGDLSTRPLGVQGDRRDMKVRFFVSESHPVMQLLACRIGA